MMIEHGKFLLELSTENVSRYSLTRGCVKKFEKQQALVSRLSSLGTDH